MKEGLVTTKLAEFLHLRFYPFGLNHELRFAPKDTHDRIELHR